MKDNNENQINKEEIDRLIDEIKIMRDEINWRVKMAYSGYAFFVTIFSLFVAYFFNSEKNTLNNDEISIVGLITVILISIYIGILNANHLIEKKNEHYIFFLQKKIYHLDGKPSYSWLSYMYGHKFSTNTIMRILTFISRIGFGLFQYGLPILLAIFTLLYLTIEYDVYVKYKSLYILSCILLFLTSISNVFLLVFVSKMLKEQKKYFNFVVLPYLKKQ